VSDPPHRLAHPEEDEPPPILGKWPLVYALVLCYLALLILAFYLFARVFDS